ncbi:MAG TPA: MMPL family transporter [Bacteroidales bacterium]|nr:MMPL family transporter [Bacteroidales bacterium]HPS16476.1 MMPL family transporter [Bacteroidales bacterium]
MWTVLVRLILRNRPGIIIVIALLTGFMAYQALTVQLSYELPRMLSSGDSTSIKYDIFKSRFGEDGNVFAVGIKNNKIFELTQFNALYELCSEIKKKEGIEEVVSITRLINIYKNDSLKKFSFGPIVPGKLKTQAEVDSIRNLIFSLPFYKGLLYNESKDVFLLGITLDKNKINDKSREGLIFDIKSTIDNYQVKTGSEVHYSGLPYIRTLTTQKIKSELILFIILSLIIAAIIMILFFKSAKVVFSSMIIVLVSIIWTLGTLSLFGFKITILTGAIPSVITIIAIENCIFLINKYHWEYKLHGNKIKALSRVVKRIGFATLMTNLTTATGFAAFVFTSNVMLREFGIVASINVMIEYLLSLALIPILFSYWAPPKEKHVEHLENKKVVKVIETIKSLVFNRRGIVYIITTLFVVVCIFGTTFMKTSGKLVDDIKSSDPIFVDLKFLEKNFNGVMPFEICIDTKKKNGVMKLSTINKINKLQQEIDSFPQFSKALSLAEFVKFAKQAFYNGDSSFYKIPNNNEKDFILSYLPTNIKGKKNLMHSFLDSTKRYTRISVQMKDVGSKEMKLIESKLRPKIDSIFNPKKFDVTITGNSVVFTKGTDFLIRNLWESLIIGILIISVLVAIVFSSYRMVVIAMICNLIPLLVTAAIMGYASIPVKPSTLIVFSIALGISIDNALLFLSKYRHELKTNEGNIKLAVSNALSETGISMIYASIVLVMGFAVFSVSEFGGTQALGMLISITLFVALFFNIIVLPSLIITLDKIITTRSFRKPIIEIYDVEVTDDNNDEMLSEELKEKN